MRSALLYIALGSLVALGLSLILGILVGSLGSDAFNALVLLILAAPCLAFASGVLGAIAAARRGRVGWTLAFVLLTIVGVAGYCAAAGQSFSNIDSSQPQNQDLSQQIFSNVEFLSLFLVPLVALLYLWLTRGGKPAEKVQATP